MIAGDKLGRIPMSISARELLVTFDKLSPSEQQEVAEEILLRSAPVGALPETALDELAAELFRGYDSEDAARAGP
jgi:hypothetical protein